jgi:hypothetical protein
LIARRRYAKAIDTLRSRVATQPNAEGHALLAVAHFQSEAYGDAARHYAAALHLAPGNAEWGAMLKLARENAHARLDVPVPDFHYFDRTALGNASGAVVAVAMHAVTTTWGRLTGYRDAGWTNWYRRSLRRGLITIAYMRDQLNARNLKNTYPAGQLTGFAPPNLPAPAGASHFRTADGSWNNLENPREGAAGRSGAATLLADENVRRQNAARPDALGRGREHAGLVHQRGHALVGRFAALGQRPRHAAAGAQRHRRQTAPHPRGHAAARRQGCRGHQLHPQLVDRRFAVAHAVHARAQRRLRPAPGAPSRLGRHLRTEDSIRNLVDRNERLLLIEHLEWRYVTQRIKV